MTGSDRAIDQDVPGSELAHTRMATYNVRSASQNAMTPNTPATHGWPAGARLPVDARVGDQRVSTDVPCAHCHYLRCFRGAHSYLVWLRCDLPALEPAVVDTEYTDGLE